MLVIVRSICTLILCLMFAVTVANAAQDDWFTYRHDSARTGAQPFASDLSDPAKISYLHVVAQFPPEGSSLPSPPCPVPCPGGFKASPIVVDGTVFIGSVNVYFYALDAASGALKWQYPKARDHALIGSCGLPTDFAGGWGSYGIPSSATYAKINGQDAVIFGAPDPDPGTDGGAGSARLFALPLSADPNNPQPIWKSHVVARVDCSSTLHERIAYSSPLVLGNTIYVGVHDTGDDPIQQGRVVAVDLNTGHLTNFQFLGAGNAPSDGSLGGGVWNALATDGTGVYFTTGNTHFPWCVWPYDTTNCRAEIEPPNNNGLSMIRVDKDTGHIDWKFNTVDFNHDGDPDWAAGATVMSTSCGELIASVQKDGWSYAVDADSVDPRGSMRWQFPPTIESEGLASFLNYVHGDDDYRRPGAAWNDVFIVRTGGEANTDDVGCQTVKDPQHPEPRPTACRGYSELHALNACATREQDRVRWIADIPNITPDSHISYSTPTVTGGIVFIGTNDNRIDNTGHLVVLADPSVVSASQQVCSNPDFPLPGCTAPYAPVWHLQPLADVPMPDGNSLASMRNEPVLAEGRVFVATNTNSPPPNSGHVYILATEDISAIVPQIFAPDTVTITPDNFAISIESN